MRYTSECEHERHTLRYTALKDGLLSWGVFVRDLEKIDRVIIAPHFIYASVNRISIGSDHGLAPLREGEQ